MSFYIVIYCLLAIVAIVGGYKIKNPSILSIFTFIMIVCFQGFRWRTGTDWIAYQECFEMSNTAQASYVEFGYYFFNRIIRFFSDSYTVFLLIECTAIAICQWIFAKQFFVKNIPAVLLYFFTGSIFPVRFTLATAIFLLSYKYICERNFVKFFIVYAIGASIHQIIALTLPLYFFGAKEYRAKSLFLIYAVCCGIGLMTDIVFKNLTDALSLVFAYLPTFSQEKALAYMQEVDESNPILAALASYINGGLFICLFLFLRKKFIFDKSYNVLLNIYVLGLSFSRIFLSTIPYLARVNLCCAGGFILMLLLALQKTRPSYRWTFTSIFFLYLLISYIGKINDYPDLYIPYYSIFSSGHRIHVY